MKFKKIENYNYKKMNKFEAYGLINMLYMELLDDADMDVHKIEAFNEAVQIYEDETIVDLKQIMKLNLGYRLDYEGDTHTAIRLGLSDNNDILMETISFSDAIPHIFKIEF